MASLLVIKGPNQGTRIPLERDRMVLGRNGDCDVVINVPSVSHSSGLLLETQSTERLRALLEISGKLSKTLELDRLLPKIVDRLFELFKQADRGFVILREEPSGRLVPKVIKTRRPQDEGNA